MVTPRCCGVQIAWMSEECRTNNCVFVCDFNKIYNHQGVTNIFLLIENTLLCDVCMKKCHLSCSSQPIS
jgi:hypothetical protein